MSDEPKPKSEPAYLTVAEAAELLRTSPKAVRTMIERGIVPGVCRPKGVRRVLLRRADLIKWIDGGAIGKETRR